MVPKSVLESFENPAVAGVMPTFSMGIMILATYIERLPLRSSIFIVVFGFMPAPRHDVFFHEKVHFEL